MLEKSAALPFDGEAALQSLSLIGDLPHALIWRSKVTHHSSSVDLGPPRMSSPPNTPKSHEWTLLHTQATPSPPLTVSPLLFSRFPLFQWLLKGAWLHFQLGATRGSFPQGGWQEIKAAHIVPDAFQFHTYVGGGENYPSPLSHASHWVCVFIYRIKLTSTEDLWVILLRIKERKIMINYLVQLMFYVWKNVPPWVSDDRVSWTGEFSLSTTGAQSRILSFVFLWMAS